MATIPEFVTTAALVMTSKVELPLVPMVTLSAIFVATPSRMAVCPSATNCAQTIVGRQSVIKRMNIPWNFNPCALRRDFILMCFLVWSEKLDFVTSKKARLFPTEIYGHSTSYSTANRQISEG